MRIQQIIQETEMQIERNLCQITSVTPVESVCPIYELQQKSYFRIFRAQCMIPFSLYSIKVVFFVTFIASKIQVRVQLYLIPMVYPPSFPVEDNGVQNNSQEIEYKKSTVPIASYSHNFIYCARCNLGIACKNHVSAYQTEEYKKQKGFYNSNLTQPI